jgi:hypothetical protein
MWSSETDVSSVRKQKPPSGEDRSEQQYSVLDTGMDVDAG